jgi:hypothetical protein
LGKDLRNGQFWLCLLDSEINVFTKIYRAVIIAINILKSSFPLNQLGTVWFNSYSLRFESWKSIMDLIPSFF